MRTDVFCAWGDGPDVGVNLNFRPDDPSFLTDPAGEHMLCLDLTAEQARDLAAQLTACAQMAEQYDLDAEDYYHDYVYVCATVDDMVEFFGLNPRSCLDELVAALEARPDPPGFDPDPVIPQALLDSLLAGD